MYSFIMYILGGISNIVVEHPETGDITYNLQDKFYSESFISDSSKSWGL